MKNLLRLFLLSCFIFLVPAEKTIAQSNYLDSLRQALKTETEDTLKTETLYSLALSSLDSSRFNDAFTYTKQLKQLSEKLKSGSDKKIIRRGKLSEADYWNLLGQIELERSNYALALKYFEVVVRLAKLLNYTEMEAEVYSNMASAYTGQGDYDSSLEYYLKSMKIDEELRDTVHLAADYINVAAVLGDSKNAGQGLPYLYKSIVLHNRINDIDGLAICMNNLGSYYEKKADSLKEAGNEAEALKNYDEALKNYMLALKLHTQANKKSGIAIANENIGVGKLRLGKTEEALDYLLKALALYRERDMKAEISFCLNNIGRAYQQQNKIAQAEVCLLQSLALARETGSNDFMMKSYEFLAEFYDETGRPAEALKYYKNYQSYHDKVFNQETTKKLVRSEMSYSFDKQKAVDRAEHEKEIIMLESENRIQKQLRFFLFLLIGLFIIALFFVQRAYNNKKRLATFLAGEDSRKELLLQEVHHRINNNLQIISSLLSLQANSADDEKLTTYLRQSQNRIQSLSVLHELLYQNNSSLQVEMKEYIDKVLDFHRDVAGTHAMKISIETGVEITKFPTKIAVPLALIINELVTNSLKYAFAGKEQGTIRITLQPQEKKASWKLSVQDDGKGLGAVEGRRKGSLGLRLVNIMVKQIGAELKTNEGAGAVFEITFTIPIKNQ